MKWLRYLTALLALVLCPRGAAAQTDAELPDAPDDGAAPAIGMEVHVGRSWYMGDSIPHVILPTFNKYPPLEFKNKKERDRYNRLVSNVKRLLPLARLARIMVVETYETLQTLPTKQARAAHLRRVEDDLRRTYTPTLKRLSRSQGRLLVKLIDRECGQTGYNIAQAFVGSFKANVYQGMAVVFGQSLSKRYDPEGDDRFTERVVRLVESGQL